MINNPSKKIYFFLFSLMIILVDQLSKFLVSNNYKSLIGKDFIFFNIDFLKNYGAAFNILSGSRILLSLISIFISFILVFLIINKDRAYNLELYSYSFLLGGTFGNGIDRILKGYVIDFINLNFLNFPVFNIADISINIGFFLIFYNLIKDRK